MRGKLGTALSFLYPFLVVLVLKTYHSYVPLRAALALKLYPAVINISLLGFFSFSLIRPPSVIERFARLREPVMTPRIVHYARNVTKVWCVFFVCNAAIAAATALWASNKVWALYNGVISYILIGTLMLLEWLVRRRGRLHDAA